MVPALGLRLQIGRAHPELDQLLAENNVVTWAFITAYNPYSRQCSPRENKERQYRLEQSLKEAGFWWYEGYSTDLKGQWPREASLLVVGIDQQSALQYGRTFQQHAILFGRLGAIAQLLRTSAGH